MPVFSTCRRSRRSAASILRGTHLSRRGRLELIQGGRIAAVVDWDTFSFVAKNCDDSGLAELEWSSDLQQLTLDSPTITDAGLRYLRYVPKSVRTDASTAVRFPTQDWQRVNKECRKLHVLNVHKARFLMPAWCISLQLTTLGELELSAVTITDGCALTFCRFERIAVDPFERHASKPALA